MIKFKFYNFAEFFLSDLALINDPAVVSGSGNLSKISPVREQALSPSKKSEK
jgi:hypothetical protein